VTGVQTCALPIWPRVWKSVRKPTAAPEFCDGDQFKRRAKPPNCRRPITKLLKLDGRRGCVSELDSGGNFGSIIADAKCWVDQTDLRFQSKSIVNVVIHYLPLFLCNRGIFQFKKLLTSRSKSIEPLTPNFFTRIVCPRPRDISMGSERTSVLLCGEAQSIEAISDRTIRMSSSDFRARRVSIESLIGTAAQPSPTRRSTARSPQNDYHNRKTR
jgi:hypothetical protein